MLVFWDVLLNRVNVICGTGGNQVAEFWTGILGLNDLLRLPIKRLSLCYESFNSFLFTRVGTTVCSVADDQAFLCTLGGLVKASGISGRGLAMAALAFQP